MHSKIIELEKRKKLLQTLLNICGNQPAAFYEIQSRIPSLKHITWEQLQQYKEASEEQDKVKNLTKKLT